MTEILIRDGKLKVIDIEDSLETYYKELKCSTIDIVNRKIGGKYYAIVCDEEGLFDDEANISMMDEETVKPMLVGRLFICRNGSNGSLKGLNQEDIDRIRRKFRHHVVWGCY